MKGGVGKTTISAHVMRVLYHANGKKVPLVDLDPQFNLTQCLRSRAEYDAEGCKQDCIRRDGTASTREPL
jgi:chromosome partitioning protein